MSQTTCIRDVDWLVGWDGYQHVYLRNSDLVFKGPDIVFVGDRYVEHVDIELSGKNRMIIPGLVDIHAHPTTEPIRKGVPMRHNPQAFGTVRSTSTCRCSIL